MKAALLKTSGVLALTVSIAGFASQAAAGTHFSCTYLASGANGAPYPGLSRPQVVLQEGRVDVEIIMEAGRGTISRVNYALIPTARTRTSTTFMDASRQVSFVTSTAGSATLNVKGLISRCTL